MFSRKSRRFALVTAAMAIAMSVLVTQAQGRTQRTFGSPGGTQCAYDTNYYYYPDFEKLCVTILPQGQDAGGYLYAVKAEVTGFNKPISWVSGHMTELMGGFWYDEGSCVGSGTGTYDTSTNRWAYGASCTGPVHHCSPGFELHVTGRAYISSTDTWSMGWYAMC